MRQFACACYRLPQTLHGSSDPRARSARIPNSFMLELLDAVEFISNTQDKLLAAHIAASANFSMQQAAEALACVRLLQESGSVPVRPCELTEIDVT